MELDYIMSLYGNIMMVFYGYNKGKVIYKSANKVYLVSGFVNGRSVLDKKETVKQLYSCIDEFYFEILT